MTDSYMIHCTEEQRNAKSIAGIGRKLFASSEGIARNCQHNYQHNATANTGRKSWRCTAFEHTKLTAQNRIINKSAHTSQRVKSSHRKTTLYFVIVNVHVAHNTLKCAYHSSVSRLKTSRSFKGPVWLVYPPKRKHSPGSSRPLKLLHSLAMKFNTRLKPNTASAS